MTWIDVGNPKPLSKINPYSPYEWINGQSLTLIKPSTLSSKSFAETILNRRTRYSFKTLSMNDLSSLLWFSNHVQEWGNSDLGFNITRRPTPSAGAIHPVHILINQPSNKTWWRYAPETHELKEILELPFIKYDIRKELSDLFDLSTATIFLLVAEPGKTFAKYESATSLVWRDVGVLLGYLSLTSEFLELNFCPLGISGEPWISSLDKQGRLLGVGAAVLGARK